MVSVDVKHHVYLLKPSWLAPCRENCQRKLALFMDRQLPWKNGLVMDRKFPRKMTWLWADSCHENPGFVYEQKVAIKILWTEGRQSRVDWMAGNSLCVGQG